MEFNVNKLKQFITGMVWRQYECNTFVFFPVFQFIGIVVLQFFFIFLSQITLLSLLYLDRFLDFPQMSVFYFVFDFIDIQVQIYFYLFQMNSYSLWMYSY